MSTNLDSRNNAGIWRGVLAIPIRLGTADSITSSIPGTPLDQLTVGALTIDSNYCVTNKHNDNRIVDDEELGVIAKLHKRDTNELIDLLYGSVPAILFGGRS